LSDEFAVVLLDVIDAGHDRVDVARMMRTRERTRNVPVIFLTARDPRSATPCKATCIARPIIWSSRSRPRFCAPRCRCSSSCSAHAKRARQLAREEERRAQAESERRRFHALLVRAPVAVAVLEGPGHVVELANERFIAMAIARCRPARS